MPYEIHETLDTIQQSGVFVSVCVCLSICIYTMRCDVITWDSYYVLNFFFQLGLSTVFRIMSQLVFYRQRKAVMSMAPVLLWMADFVSLR